MISTRVTQNEITPMNIYHPNFYDAKNYPYGRLRTTMRYWIETDQGCFEKTKTGKPKQCKGQRECSQSINPKTNRLNAPHCGTYSPLLAAYLDLRDVSSMGDPKLKVIAAPSYYNATAAQLADFGKAFGKTFGSFEKETFDFITKVQDAYAQKHPSSS